MRLFVFASFVVISSCAPLPETGACELAAEREGCPECADGTVTCTFGNSSVTEISCGGCQAESALLAELCDAGETASREAIEAGMECTEAL